MLNFLKKIFREEEREIKKPLEISLQNLEEWLQEKSKPLTEETRQHSGDILMKIDEELQRARFNAEALENAKLQNPNIPFKAKQYMEGNRKAYVRAVSSFLGRMEINNRDYFYLIGFCRQFEDMINDLNKSTLRSYTILQEFFANEAGKIAQNLKNFDTLIKELESVLNSKKIAAVNEAVKKIQGLKARQSQKINANVELKTAEAELKLSISRKEEIMADIEKFSKSEQHNSFLKLSEEKKSKAGAFYSDENVILQSFSILERPLRKYSHMAFEHEEAVLDYLKSPIETLANDKQMKISDILKSLEASLNDGKIQIDEKKKEKAIEEIKKLSREFIEGFIKKYFSFRSEIDDIEGRIKMTGVPEKFRDFSRQLDEINMKIEKCNDEFDKLKNDDAKLENSITNLTNDIENSARNMFGEEIKITV